MRRVGGEEKEEREGRVGVNPDLRGEAPIWQKRFWEHHIRDDRDFAAHVEYCWINPVKHGLVAHPSDWAWSSVRRAGFTPPLRRLGLGNGGVGFYPTVAHYQNFSSRNPEK